MTETERVLQVLLHDVRTPIGVAQGYVRLLREQRLDTAEDQERALARTMDALGRISRLCDDAGGFLITEKASTHGPVAATRFITSVEARVGEWGFVVERWVIDPAAHVRAGSDVDRLAGAVGLLLGTVKREGDTKPPALRIEATASDLQFVAAGNGLPAAAAGEPTPFDPWRNRGLAVPLAYRAIDHASGRVSCVGHTLVVAFPLETSPA